jgi:hypothetical protein
MKVLKKAIITNTNGKSGLAPKAHAILLLIASWIIHHTSTRIMKIRNDVNIHTINQIKKVIKICHQLGFEGSRSIENCVDGVDGVDVMLIE